jgi:hypothetical protein
LEICDVVVGLLAVSVVQAVILTSRGSNGRALINLPSLTNLMEQCQSLKVLRLVNIEALDEDQISVLGAYSRPDLEIVLVGCAITHAGESTLTEVLTRNKGPTKLDLCDIDNFVLANGLRGNSRLKSWRPNLSINREVANREVLAIMDALQENKGLVDLDLCYGLHENDETWGAICDSLKAHPTIEVLDLRADHADTTTAPAVLKFRMQLLLDMVKVNMSIRTIHLNSYHSQHEIFRESIIPCLEMNNLRSRVRAIQKTLPVMYRAKVLGRALLAARKDVNLFWMLLSGNAEVAFPSSTTTIAAAATVAASSAANVTAVAASVMSALTTTTTSSIPKVAAAATAAINAATPSTASDAFAPAAADVATPFAGQKRKARS